MELAEMSIRQMLSLNLVTAAAILLIWYLSHLAEMAKWKQQRQDEAEGAGQTAKSGNAGQRTHDQMGINGPAVARRVGATDQNHNQDTERLMKLLERQTNINELHASLLQNINLKIDQIKNLK